ncbi:unnamed protein product [Oppiella nova]|uniref:WH1 domain-containing protein n=1 Tax=Oppiella nova TaxID=334625 RepID=A0A7R9LZA8_9ACAR|nr:unnamed protein product [Oppiella nova]CAG2168459.1 unnamed protein product [Oppiella nova]
MKIALLLAVLFVGVNAAPNSREFTGKRWVVLCAGGAGWGNYPFQASIYHAYHIFLNHGIPEENIIVMHPDDLANNKANPTPNIVVNQVNGTDVYHGVPKHYVGKDVTPKNFLGILKGDSELKAAGKRVVESGPDDHVFVFFMDHGSTGGHFSDYWYSDSETKDFNSETIETQFKFIASHTKVLLNNEKEEAQHYGDLSVGQLTLAEFFVDNSEKLRYTQELKNILNGRQYADNHLRQYVQSIESLTGLGANVILNGKLELNNRDCYQKFVETFSDKCFNLGQTLCTTLVQVVVSVRPNHQHWRVARDVGVACVVKDYDKLQHYIRVYNYSERNVCTEQRLYASFAYRAALDMFHVFEGSDSMVGLNFADCDDAIRFQEVVTQCLRERKFFDRFGEIGKPEKFIHLQSLTYVNGVRASTSSPPLDRELMDRMETIGFTKDEMNEKLFKRSIHEYMDTLRRKSIANKRPSIMAPVDTCGASGVGIYPTAPTLTDDMPTPAPRSTVVRKSVSTQTQPTLSIEFLICERFLPVDALPAPTDAMSSATFY